LTVRVGPEGSQQDFLLHQATMCKRSEFFNRALNGNWSEKKDRLVKLPEDDTKIFSLYVNLIYTGEIPGQTGYSKMMQSHCTPAMILGILCEIQVNIRIGETQLHVRRLIVRHDNLRQS
jgi:hypothetical protein